MKVLITGFDPFGGESINPGWEAIKKMKDNIDGIEVIKLEIPTVFRKSAEKLYEGIEHHKPDAVICVGQAGGRFDMSIERVAINIDDGRIADNEGIQPIDTVIYEDGEAAYFATLPIKGMVQDMKEAKIPASVSNTAGTFVCNHIMYCLLHYVKKNNLNIKGGFVHVPYITEQVVEKKGVPYMEVSTITRALEVCVASLKKYDTDIKVSGGKEF